MSKENLQIFMSICMRINALSETRDFLHAELKKLKEPVVYEEIEKAFQEAVEKEAKDLEEFSENLNERRQGENEFD